MKESIHSQLSLNRLLFISIAKSLWKMPSLFISSVRQQYAFESVLRTCKRSGYRTSTEHFEDGNLRIVVHVDDPKDQLRVLGAETNE